MDDRRLISALSGLVDASLAHELVTDFLKIRSDYATRTLERSSAGKFVETVVQCLQEISTGTYDTKPRVDHYLDKQAEHQASLPDGLRFCTARIARAMYTLRNKRNIAHKGEVDPNTYDLGFLHQAAAWIMAEMVRSASGLSMQEAGELVSLLQTPVGTLVEEIDGTRLVHANVSTRAEILILLHSHYPGQVTTEEINKSLVARSQSSIRSRLSELRTKKLVYGEGRGGYKLTLQGYDAAVAEIRNLQS